MSASTVIDMAPAILQRAPAASTDTTLESLLLALVTEVRGLRADVAALSRRLAALALDDGRFVAIVAATTEGHRFSVDELFDHAQLHAELAAALHGATCQHVGKRLRRLAGRPIDGLMVRRVGRDENGAVWTVSAADLHGPFARDGV